MKKWKIFTASVISSSHAVWEANSSSSVPKEPHLKEGRAFQHLRSDLTASLVCLQLSTPVASMLARGWTQLRVSCAASLGVGWFCSLSLVFIWDFPLNLSMEELLPLSNLKLDWGFWELWACREGVAAGFSSLEPPESISGFSRPPLYNTQLFFHKL